MTNFHFFPETPAKIFLAKFQLSSSSSIFIKTHYKISLWQFSRSFFLPPTHQNSSPAFFSNRNFVPSPRKKVIWTRNLIEFNLKVNTNVRFHCRRYRDRGICGMIERLFVTTQSFLFTCRVRVVFRLPAKILAISTVLMFIYLFW